jgi:5'-nucleotidase
MPPHITGRITPATRQINGERVTAYAVDATPALAVIHAVTELAPRHPSLVISGINFGANLGTEVTISGTVGAALEGGALGIPAMAISLEMDPVYHLAGDDSEDYAASMAFTHQFAWHLLTNTLPHDVDALNVNIPSDATPHTPWRLTCLSRQRYYVPLAPDRANGQGRPGFSLIGDVSQAEPDSDIRAVKVDRVVAVTPLSLDLTSRADFDTVGSCLGAPEMYLDVPELLMVGES